MAVVGSVQILLDVNTAKMSSFSAAANRVAADTARMRGAMRGVGNEASNSFIKAGQAAVAFNGHLGGMGNRLRSIGLLIGSLDTAAVAAGAGFATAAAGLNLFITRADRMKRAENDLRTITTSASNLADVQKELFNISQRARAPMEGTIMLYARTARALESFGTSQKDVLRITETVQKAFAVGGATPAEAMGAAIQLSQGIASNRFSGEEYRSVSENAPVLLRAMADQLGVNIGKLREMAYAGKLTGDVVAKAILGASDAIDKQFGKTVSTVGQSIARISNSFDQYTYETDKALGITNKLAAAGNFLADNFNVAGDSLLTLSTLLGSLALGRLGSVLVGTKNQETGKFGGIQGQIRYGLFHATRERAQAEKEAALKEFDSYKKQIAEIDRQIKAMESNGGLDQKGADRVINERLNQTNAIAATRARVISADEKINKLAADRIALTGKIKTAQAAVVEGLRAEQVEAQRIVKSQRMQLINAGRRFRNSGRLADFEREVKEVERLQKAQEDYAKSTERLKAAQGGVFDSAALRKYGSEINEINRQLVSNQKAQARASADLLKAQENYVAAQRLSPAIQEKTRGELARSAQVLDGLKERQVELNSLYTEAARRIDIAGRRISFVGAAMDRLKGFGRGLLGVVGGAPGLALTGAITGFALIATHIAKANQETEEWKQSLRDAGYLVDDVAEGASKIDEAIETKNLSALRLELQKTNEQLNKVRDGGFLADLGFTNPGIKQISDEVSNQIAKLQLIQESFTRRGAAAPQFLKNDQADFLRFNEIINGAKESGEVTNELNDELQALANKHNELDPLLETFRAIVKVVDAASRRADDLKKSIEDIAKSQGIPGWLQDAQFQTDAAKKAEEVRKSLNDLKKERLREAGLSPEDKAVEDRIDDVVKAAKKKGIAITDAYKAEVRAQAEAEIAAEKATKQAEGLKDLRLDALAGQMDEWNQNIIQTARSLGVSREELEKYINAVTSGDLSKVPAIFKDIAKAMEQASANTLLKDLKDINVQAATAGLSEIDKHLVEIAQSSGMSYGNVQKLITALETGDFSGISKTLTSIREGLRSIATANLTKDLQFERDQMFRSPEDQYIASRLRSAGLPVDLDSYEAGLLKANLQLERMKDAWEDVFDTARDGIDGVIDALFDGGSIEDALKNAGRQLARTLFDQAITNPLKNWLTGSSLNTIADLGIFGNGASSGRGGGFGGLLGNLFGAQKAVASMQVSAASVFINGAPLGLPGAGGLSSLLGGPNTPASAQNLLNSLGSPLGAANTNIDRTITGSIANASGSIQSQVWNFFARKGLALHQIAGIMGNIGAESAFNPLAIGDAGNAFGLFQHNDRAANLFSFLGGRGNLSNVQGQLEFAWKELQGSESRALKALLASKDVRGATAAFAGFERPRGFSWANPEAAHNFIGRLRGAEQALTRFGGGADSATAALGSFNESTVTAFTNLTGATGTAAKGLESFGGGMGKLGNALSQFPAAPSGGGGIFGWLGSLLGGLGGGLPSLSYMNAISPAATSAILSGAAGLFANGSAFLAGNVIPFAKGDILKSPAFFPMSHGRTGLIGEAGPEAIMPLRRGPDGRLGVSAHMPTASASQTNAGTVEAIVNAISKKLSLSVKNVNVFDPSVVGDYLRTDEGEQLMMNVIRKNRAA